MKTKQSYRHKQRIKNRIPDSTKRYVAYCMEISIILQKLIFERNITYEEFAYDMDIPLPELVDGWLTGSHNFNLKQLAIISSYFNFNFINPDLSQTV